MTPAEWNMHFTPKLMAFWLLFSVSGPAVRADAPPQKPGQTAFDERYAAVRKRAVLDLSELARWCRANGLADEEERVRLDIKQLNPYASELPRDLEAGTHPEARRDASAERRWPERRKRTYDGIVSAHLNLARRAAEEKRYGSADELLLAAQSFSRMDAQVTSAAREMTKGFPIRVMSFNLLVPGVPWDTYGMDRRKHVIRRCIQALRPDVVGTQETSRVIVRHLRASLPDGYQWITVSTISKGKRQQGNDTCAILYNTERLKLVEADYSLLNEAMPTQVGRSGFGSGYHRMIIWARFKPRDPALGCEQGFYLYNTHLEPFAKGAGVRKKQIRAITTKILPLHTGNPVRVFVGDFNEARFGTVGDTLRDFGFDGYRKGIDWVVATEPGQIVEARSLLFREQGVLPSDHKPVIAYLKCN